MKETVVKPRKCVECGTLFVARSTLATNAQYCCKQCSNKAAHRRAMLRKRDLQREILASQVDNTQDYISIPEAIAKYQVSRSALYLQIELGNIPTVRISARKIRVKQQDIADRYPTRTEQKVAKPLPPKPKLYRLEPEDCYTIGQVCEKYHLNDGTVYRMVRKFHIPSRQFGNFVYVPKEEVDDFFTNKTFKL